MTQSMRMKIEIFFDSSRTRRRRDDHWKSGGKNRIDRAGPANKLMNGRPRGRGHLPDQIPIFSISSKVSASEVRS